VEFAPYRSQDCRICVVILLNVLAGLTKQCRKPWRPTTRFCFGRITNRQWGCDLRSLHAHIKDKRNSRINLSTRICALEAIWWKRRTSCQSGHVSFARAESSPIRSTDINKYLRLCRRIQALHRSIRNVCKAGCLKFVVLLWRCPRLDCTSDHDCHQHRKSARVLSFFHSPRVDNICAVFKSPGPTLDASRTSDKSATTHVFFCSIFLYAMRVEGNESHPHSAFISSSQRPAGPTLRCRC